jgi:hypothetical protein
VSHILEFLDLVDVPNSYSGADNYRLKIDGTAVEFVDDTVLNLNDTPATFSGYPSAYVKVNSGSSALEFVTDDTLHFTVDGEISALDVASPAATDVLVIEDASDTWSKKKVTAQSIADLGGGGTDDDAIHDNVANEITAIANKISVADADEFIIEDGEASYIKKAVTAKNFGAYVEASMGGPFLAADGSVPLTADWDAGSFEIRADQFYADGTGAPFIVSSSVQVSNLNADYLDGVHLDGIDYSVITTNDASTNIVAEELEELSDGSSTTLHTHANIGNGPFLPLTGGNLSGNLYIDTATTPALQVRPSGGAVDRLVISAAAGITSISKYDDTGQTIIRIDPIPSDGTSAALFQLFRTTSTSGTRTLTMYEGDGTATVQHEFNLGTGAVSLCQQAGDLTVGGHLGLKSVPTDPGATTEVRVGLGTGGSFRVQTDLAYLDIGPQTSAWCHMTTSASSGFYFSNPVRMSQLLTCGDAWGSALWTRGVIKIDNNVWGGMGYMNAAPILYLADNNTGALQFLLGTFSQARTYNFTIRGTNWYNTRKPWEIICTVQVGTGPGAAELYAEVVAGFPPFDVVSIAKDGSGNECIIFGDESSTVLGYYCNITVPHFTSSGNPGIGAVDDFTLTRITSVSGYVFYQTDVAISNPHQAPSTTAVTRHGAANAVAGYSYYTIVDLSAGPYMVCLIMNNDSIESMRFRVTCDGTVTWLSPSNILIGQVDTGPGAALNVAPIFARKSLKIEKYNPYSTTKTLTHLLVYHTLSFN